MRVAREGGLGVAAQGTGHGAAAMGPLDDVVLLKTERMDGVEVDADARTARVEAGVLWLALLEACDPARARGGWPARRPTSASSATRLGGGLGWLGRKHGFACNKIISASTSSPPTARRGSVDADSEPDLFWAMRGGGGSFAIVTAMDTALVPAREIYAGTVILPADDARGILQSYREWAAGVPEELTSVVRLLHLPPLPQVPEPLRDRDVVTIGACYLGPEDEAVELLGADPRARASRSWTLFAPMAPSGLVRIAMDPEEPVPGLVHGALLSDLDEKAVDAFVDVAGPGLGLAAALGGAASARRRVVTARRGRGRTLAPRRGVRHSTASAWRWRREWRRRSTPTSTA